MLILINIGEEYLFTSNLLKWNNTIENKIHTQQRKRLEIQSMWSPRKSIITRHIEPGKTQLSTPHGVGGKNQLHLHLLIILSNTEDAQGSHRDSHNSNHERFLNDQRWRFTAECGCHNFLFTVTEGGDASRGWKESTGFQLQLSILFPCLLASKHFSYNFLAFSLFLKQPCTIKPLSFFNQHANCVS